MRNVLRFVLAALVLLSAHALAAERFTYFVSDANGSPIAAMDEQGNVLWRESYAPWGARLTRDPANDARTAYTGKPEDTDTGLVYMGARWYDPGVGRFTSVDPVGYHNENIQSFGRYTYANSSPYVYWDPDGKDAVLLVDRNAAESFGRAQGHVTLYFQRRDGSWLSYDYSASDHSYETRLNRIILNIGVEDKATVSERPNGVPEQLVGSDVFRYETTDSQDRRIQLAVEREVRRSAKGESRYRLLSNNCLDSVARVLETAGVAMGGQLWRQSPNGWADSKKNGERHDAQ